MRSEIFRRDERGYTLPEILTAVAISGILAAIAVIIFLALLERWRVEAAADQLASDMRLAHSNATQGLTDWRLVMASDGIPLAGCSGADYCLIELKAAYSADDASPALAPDTPPSPKGLPRGTKIGEFSFDPDCSGGDPDAVVAPSRCGPEGTRTLEFNSNGTVRTLRPGQSGTVRVSSEDGSPSCGVVFQAPTARIRIGEIVYG
ncbi:pilus assembly FimT family protein [Rubrobacter tropicus]|uniref:pilus assembly FimT family protein n=1 Tax=Rubrobacter tropicus TaxID=2653851 RepID=UPI00140AB998|nr:prepilin-type N-terminal cleavage/methylation domain-containing protein [Rubrobacter tropicus]